jgi:cytoskeletal protein CcmA (bactofilin family)
VADTLTVWGRINGRIRCKDVTLEETAVVNGDILHEAIQVARGAQIEGMMKRGVEAASSAASPAKAPTAKPAEPDKPAVALVGGAEATAKGEG